MIANSLGPPDSGYRCFDNPGKGTKRAFRLGPQGSGAIIPFSQQFRESHRCSETPTVWGRGLIGSAHGIKLSLGLAQLIERPFLNPVLSWCRSSNGRNHIQVSGQAFIRCPQSIFRSFLASSGVPISRPSSRAMVAIFFTMSALRRIFSFLWG